MGKPDFPTPSPRAYFHVRKPGVKKAPGFFVAVDNQTPADSQGRLIEERDSARQALD
jgi:hypothetical protein